MSVLEYQIPEDKGGIEVYIKLKKETLRLSAMIKELGDEYVVGNGKAEMLRFADRLEKAANGLI